MRQTQFSKSLFPTTTNGLRFRRLKLSLPSGQFFTCWSTFFAAKSSVSSTRAITIHYGGQNYRLVSSNNIPTIPLRSIVDVLEYSDGSIYVAYKGRIYSVELVPEAETLRKNTVNATVSKPKERGKSLSPHKPAPNHPWRKRVVAPNASCATNDSSTNNGLTTLASGRSQFPNS